MEFIFGMLVGLCISAIVFCGLGEYFSLRENKDD